MHCAQNALKCFTAECEVAKMKISTLKSEADCSETPTVVLTFGIFHFCRAYMSVKELKEELQLSSADTLNVFFASNSAREELAGAATWPWAKEALTPQGKMADFN